MGVPSRDLYRKEVQCLIRHPTLNGEELTINYSLSAHYPPLPPRVTLLESPSLGFKCQVDGNPEAVKYTWRRDGRLISGNGVKADVNKLHFQEFTSDMNGLYDCEVSNMYGSATGFLHLYTHKNERHYVFFWISFIGLGVFTLGLLYRFVSRRKSAEETANEPIEPIESFEPIEDSEQSSHQCPMQEISSSKDSPEQSAPMMPEERRSSSEDDT
ncbi:uncharacterized protein LOC134078696 [Sardina pilchardus]|uniref:uncharacterized protein LOC134078696 n=1 Tax=Sardina pilchardus TaxID=27697 RepID=UPI002E0D85A3